MRAALIVVLAVLAGLAGLAGPVAAQGFPPELSPYERGLQGDTSFGAFDVNDGARCPAAAVKKYLGDGVIPRAAVLGKNAFGKDYTAGEASDGMRLILQQTLDLLRNHGDADIVKHHICVGMFKFPKGPNATSSKSGYIMVDPRLVDVVNAMPDRTMFSLEMFWVHELAHQFQYWYGNPFETDARDRRGDAADCVAAALITLRWTDPFAIKQSADGVVVAAARVGDIAHESKSHHGTPFERKTAARAGLNIVYEVRAAGGKVKMPGSADLLKQCNAFVIARDKQHGPNWAEK